VPRELSSDEVDRPGVHAAEYEPERERIDLAARKELELASETERRRVDSEVEEEPETVSI
jgi:hypothetical protein